MAVDVKTWASKFKNLTDNDETIQCMGKYYTCSFMYDMTDRKVIVEMHDGKVKNINTDPAPLDPYDFALRASAQTWRELLSAATTGIRLFENYAIGRQHSIVFTAWQPYFPVFKSTSHKRLMTICILAD